MSLDISPAEALLDTDAHADAPLPAYTLWLMAAACGVSAANIYYNQPLLGYIRNSFAVSETQAGMVSTAGQVGYGVGMFFFVPLGDIVDRRKIVLLLTWSCLFLLVGMAFAQSLRTLIAFQFLVGVTAMSAQLLIPLGIDLTPPAQRGRTVGLLMGGLLSGLLMARTVAGGVADHFGWHAVFGMGAGLMLVLALALQAGLPHRAASLHLPYSKLIASLVPISHTPRLWPASLISGLSFGCFTAFWTALSFLMIEHFNKGASAAGLFGIIGLIGALAAPLAGRLSDQRGAAFTVTIALCLAMASFVLMWAWLTITGLIIGVLLMDLGVQSIQVACQSEVVTLLPEARSRLNTIYMVTRFIGAAAGSATGALAWTHYRWPGVCAAAIAMLMVAMIIHQVSGKKVHFLRFALLSSHRRGSHILPAKERDCMADRKPLVAVIGAGFAGVKVVQGLRKAPVEIAMIDRHNYHLFQPLLYQVATAALSPADIAYPIRQIFRGQENVEVILADVRHIDPATLTVGGQQASMKFDYIVLAVGATHSYFGHPEWAQDAPGLKTIDDATEIRKRILLAFEEAEHEADEDARRAKLTFVVIGGGPTGVEMAGAMREIAAHSISQDFHRIDTKTARIILVHGGDRLLQAFHPKLSARAKRDLEAMGVEVRLNARVTKVERDKVYIGEEELDAANIMWAAGVQGQALLKSLGAPMTKSGQIEVQPDCSVPGHPNIFVIGDAAHLKDVKGVTVPGLAPAAMQMGKYVAKLIRLETTGTLKPADRPPFKYFDKGTLATIGTRRAVADIWGVRFGGFFAWITWSLVHLAFLVSFRSKIMVMLTWITAYFFRSREARLITGPVHMELRKVRLLDGTEMMMEHSSIDETIAPSPV